MYIITNKQNRWGFCSLIIYKNLLTIYMNKAKTELHGIWLDFNQDSLSPTLTL